ncbi:Na(+)/H(+) antiporter subunit D [Desulfocurvus sp. DL9XJH121]
MNSFVLHPAVIMILGALFVPFLRGNAKRLVMLALPLASLYNLCLIPNGAHCQIHFLGFDLMPVMMDRMSFLFGLIFHIVTAIGMVFAFQHEDNVQHVFALFYAGAVQGVVFAGDMLTLFLFWECLTVTAAVIIWSNRTEQARNAGFRYIMVHAAGGLCLLAGIVLRQRVHGTIEFGYIGLTDLSSALIFIGFGVNAAWPGFHAWLTDAYPTASPTGTVFLSAFTTKSAVYVLARAFPGTELLIWIGAIMTAFPIFFAVIENDLRRVLSYSLVNQVGFMMVGIGIGTQLSINGTCAHAFAHILYKGLLFMSMGAVMHRTGKINATDLGGLYKSMPWTTLFCCIGAASISAFPLTSGFISKSMVVTASGEGHYVLVWFALIFASAGVFHHSGIKIPFFAFFGHDAGWRVKEAPWNMLLAMGVAAFFCIGVGVYPKPLYNLLPYPVDFVPYTAPHVLSQLQLLFFSALAFTLLMLSGLYPAEMRCVNLDADLLYRFGGRWFALAMDKILNSLNRIFDELFHKGACVALTNYFTAAPMRLTLMVLPLAGARRERVKRYFKAGMSPIGLSVAVATLYLFSFIIMTLK